MGGLVDLKYLSWLPSNATATPLAERVMIMDRTWMTIFKFQQNLEVSSKNKSEINVQLEDVPS